MSDEGEELFPMHSPFVQKLLAMQAIECLVGRMDHPDDEPQPGVELRLAYVDDYWVAVLHEEGADEDTAPRVRGADLGHVVRRMARGVAPCETILLSDDGEEDLCLMCEGSGGIPADVQPEAERVLFVPCPACGGHGLALGGPQ